MYGIFKKWSLLSNINSTLATFNGLRLLLPENITSLIDPSPRRDFTDCSPNTQRTASTTLLFPEPFGPTIQVILSSSFISNLSANDLNPVVIISFKYIHFHPTNKYTINQFVRQEILYM